MIEQNKFDDQRLIEIRASQEDPIVQYYIVRTDIKMSVGKIAAQVAHAAQMFSFRYNEFLQNPEGHEEQLEMTKRWIDGSFRKVTLKGDQKTFDAFKTDPNMSVFLVKDAGLTEVECGTETIIVTWPMLKSKRPKYLARLRIL